MKNHILLLFSLLITFLSFSQDLKKYKFDYYTVYDLKTNSSSTYKNRYIIGNSNDKSYFIYLYSNNKDEIIKMNLFDITNNKKYEFKIEKINFKSIKSFEDISKSYTIYNYNFKTKDTKKSIIDVEYDTIDSETKITIKVYKNSRKRKLKYTSYLYSKEVPFVKNQFYITDIIFAYKIDLNKINTSGVLTKQYIVDKSSNKKLITELLDINKLDFTLELKTEPAITNTSTTIKIR